MSESLTHRAAPTDSEHPSLAFSLTLFAVLSYLGNHAGAVLRYPEVGSAVLFLPYAVLTAALVVRRRREWIFFVLAGSVMHLATHWPQWSLSWVLLADAANIARALCAAILLRRLFGGPPRLQGVGALLQFVVVAAVLAPAVGATLGAANAVLHGASPSYWLTWQAWFVSNALTGLTMLPALLAVFAWAGPRRGTSAPPARIAESLLLAVALAGTCVIAFLPPSGGGWRLALPFYAPLPVLLWAALRFGPEGASLALTAVAFFAIWSADRARGPFLASSPDDNVITLQAFFFLTTLPVLCIAAVNSAREGAARLYEALLASLHDHVAILDAHGLVIAANDSWRRFAGADDHPPHRAGQGDDYLAACREAAARGDPAAERALAGVISVLGRHERRFEMEYERDARRQAYTLTVEALERSGGGAVITRSDVTARRQAQLEIEEQRRELSHLARAAVLGQLSGALAHELNQPLTAILSNADAARYLLAREPLDMAELREILEDIAGQDRRAADVIKHLRAFFKHGEPDREEVDAGELVQEVLLLAHEEMIARRVSPTAFLDPDLPPLLGDRVELQQVLLNLLLNACEAMDGNPAAERALSLSVSSEDGHVHFSVRDQGTGIAPLLLERMFEPFTTTKAEGLGLGLSISRTIINAHGGRLWAENNADRGATVHCVLPATGVSAAGRARATG